MPAPETLYHAICQHLDRYWATTGRSRPALRRLSLLILGLIAAKSCVLAQMAAELLVLEVTDATQPESIERRLRRALSDPRLSAPAGYHTELQAVLDWPAVLQGSRRVVLALDESANEAAYHLLRVSLPYWGGALPLAWRLWEQNVPLPPGHYWTRLDQVLAEVAALLPPGVRVVLVADRAYDVYPFVQRLRAHGWHWILRAKAEGTLRFRTRRGRERTLRGLVHHYLAHPGSRWKTRGQVFKDAGWLATSVVGLWAAEQEERLVVLTDLPARWNVLALYDRRFWIEPGFRTDKAHGWQWEDSQVQGVAHHDRLLLAMAWASLLMLALGVAEAQRRLAAVAHRPCPDSRRPGQPRHARASLFTLGLRAVRRWLYGTTAQPLPWHLPDLDAPSWLARWYHAQARHRLRCQTVRP